MRSSTRSGSGCLPRIYRRELSSRSALRASLVSTAPGAFSARFEPKRRSLVSISAPPVPDLALPRTTNRYQQQSGSTLVGRPRNDLAEVLRSRRAEGGGGLRSCRRQRAEILVQSPAVYDVSRRGPAGEWRNW